MAKSWVFYLFSQPYINPDDMESPATQAAYDSYLDQCVRNEELGFEGVFFSEHHFSGLNLTPSPHIFIAAVAQRTSRLRLGVMGSVLPLHDVRRLAEECGMLDYLTGGRLEVGIGPGAGVSESVKAGLDAEEIRPRYSSGAEVLAKYLTGKRVTHHDDFYNLDDVPIVPRMRQDSPRVWVTAMSPQSVTWAAQQGFNVCTAWFATEMVAQLSSTYREASAEAGRTADPSNFGVRRRVFVAPTDAEAQDLADAAMDPVSAAVARDLGVSFEAADPAIRGMFANPDDIITGSPQTVTERLVEQVRTIGAGHVVFLPDAKMFTAEDLRRSHELIGKEVAPVLASITVGEPAAQASA
jgi:alkanesulfonate monooxygenase SsuD/methylene tetrahydromethanopterin reductase-like flavin-dependent oxidoreductase (luciferase family)